MIDRIVLLLSLLGIGWAIRLTSIKVNRDRIDKIINTFTNLLYSLFFPLMFFNIFAERGLNLADLSITILVFSYTMISLVILYMVTHRYSKKLRNAVIVTAIFPNVIFLGFPVVITLCGDITYASLYSLVMLVLNITVGGLLGMQRHEIVWSIIKLPILYGFASGVVAHYVIGDIVITFTSFAKTITSVISTYGAAMVMGYSIPASTTILSRYYKLIGLQIIYRFVASPLIHHILTIPLVLPYEACQQVIIESMMPPALTNTILARVHGWDYEYAASTTLITTLISLAVIPVLASLGIV